jgi:hypothetical protein
MYESTIGKVLNESQKIAKMTVLPLITVIEKMINFVSKRKLVK